MSDLIKPGAMFVPKVDPDALEKAAADIRDQGGKISESGQDIKSAWSGLDSCYSAPESGTLLSAMNPVAEKGDSIDGDLGKVATALETFAEAARELKAKLTDARDDAKDFRESIKGDEDWDEGGWFGGESEKVQEHNDLLDRVNRLTHRYMEAERECANSITSLFKGGTTFVPVGDFEPWGDKKEYGTEKPLEAAPWGKPQGTDHWWGVDAAHGGGDVLMGSVEDIGGMVGAHGDEGWLWDGGEWGDNLGSYWGDAATGPFAMVGAYNPETGQFSDSWGEVGEVAGTAWKNAAHGFVPWTEYGERPGYVYGTAGTNVGMIAGGAALTATGVGAPIGIPMAASRVGRIFGSAGGGDGHFSGGSGPESQGSGRPENSGAPETGRYRPGQLPNTPGQSEGPPGGIEAGGDGADLGDIGGMDESLEGLEQAQRSAPPEGAPAPGSEQTPDAPSEPSPAPEPEPADRPAEAGGNPDGDAEAGDRPTDTPSDRPEGQESSRRDPTTEEVDEEFGEIARRNEELADGMDAADGGRMSELDGEDPWSMEALEDAQEQGARRGPGEDARVPVTPDGMEMSNDEPGNGNNGNEGDAPGTDPETGRADPREDGRPQGESHSSGQGDGAGGGGRGGSGGPPPPPGGPPEGPPGEGPNGPDRDGPGEEQGERDDKPQYSHLDVPQGLTEEQFAEAANELQNEVGGLGGEIVVQGSRATETAGPQSDIDFGIRIDRALFEEVLAEKFGSPNPGSAKERTMMHAIETGKIQAGEAGMRGLRKRLEVKLGMLVDVSIICQDGQFDKPPFVKVN